MDSIKELQEKIIAALGVAADAIAENSRNSDRADCVSALAEALRITEIVRASWEGRKKPPV